MEGKICRREYEYQQMWGRTEIYRPVHGVVIESLSHERTKVLYFEAQGSGFGNYTALKLDLNNLFVWVF